MAPGGTRLSAALGWWHPLSAAPSTQPLRFASAKALSRCHNILMMRH